MLGYKDDELPNDFSVWEELTEPGDVKKSWEMQNEMINKERNGFELQFKMKHKDGHWVHILSRAVAIFDESGNAVRIVGTHIDLTKLIAAEKVLKKEKDFSELIINTSKAIIVGLDRNHKIKLFNQGAENITGYNEEEVLGKDWFNIFFSEEMIEEMNRVWKKAWGVDSHSYTNLIFTKDGKEKNISWQSSGLYIGTEDEHMLISIGEDITERQLAEQQYKDFVEEAKIAILIDDLDGNFVYFNNRFTELFGYSELEIKQKNIRDLVIPQDVDRVMDLHNKRFTKQTEIGNYEFQGVRKDGNFIRLEVSVTVIEKDNTVIGTRSYLWDTTGRKRNEEELKKHREHLEEIVEKRTSELEKLNIDLIQKNDELEGYNELFIGREFRIKELKNKVDELSKKIELNNL